MSTFNVQQFLTAVKTVALKAETSSECFKLIDWTLGNLPYVGHGEADHSLFKALDDMCHYWKDVGCAEDEIMPALAIAYIFAAHWRLDRAELDLLADRQARCDWMIQNPNFDEEWATYKQFCDKYSAELNH